MTRSIEIVVVDKLTIVSSSDDQFLPPTRSGHLLHTPLGPKHSLFSCIIGIKKIVSKLCNSSSKSSTYQRRLDKTNSSSICSGVRSKHKGVSCATRPGHVCLDHSRQAWANSKGTTLLATLETRSQAIQDLTKSLEDTEKNLEVKS